MENAKLLEHRHFMIHKPFGFLSQFITNQKARKKPLLGELFDFPKGTMAIGRLDVNSEGLLLLTTDGKISNFIAKRGKVEKEYYVQIDGEITNDKIDKLQNGVEIGINGEKYLTKKCVVKKIDKPNFEERSKKIRDERHGPTSWISIILTEGKFRQVRKMTASVGCPTLRLVRVRVGDIVLDKMKSGEVKEIKL